jgi:hypothetical protein
MSIDKRLISTGAAPAGCTADALDIFGDSSCIALYGLNYDGSDAGGNYNGTPSNVTFNEPGYIDYAASFNGSSSKIDLGDVDFFQGDFTISMWFYPITNTGTDFQVLGIKRNNAAGQGDSTQEISIMLYEANQTTYPQKALFAIGGGGTNYNSLRTTNTYNFDSWNFIVAKISGTSMSVTLNGTETTGTFAGTRQNLSDEFRLGNKYGVDGDYPLEGKLDQVRIFNKALSAAEVTTLYGEVACEYTCTTDTNGFPASASSNLVAYYKLDNDATDETGSYNGTASNVTFDGGRYGASASFNGSSSYVNMGDPVALRLLGSYSISFWVKFNSTSGIQRIVNKDNANDYSGGYSIYTNGTSFEVVHSNGSYNGFAVSNAFTTGIWYNFVITFDSSNNSLKAYKNNAQVAITTTNGSLTNSGDSLFFGTFGQSSPLGQYLNGSLDQVRIFNKALSASEVSTIYEDEHQCYITVDSTDPFGDSNNIALYEFENNANDSTGSYNGTASNVTYSTDSIIGTYAASFNGSSSVINTSYTPTVANLRTVSLWFKTNTTTFAVMQSVGPYGVGSGYTWEWIYILADGTITGGYGANNGGAVYQKATTESFNDDNWHHLALTLNGVYGTGSSVKLYIDGVEPSTTTDTTWNTSISTIQGTFTLGALKEYSGPNFYYTGKLDQVRIFDRELNGDEVWKLYAEGASG